jgi:rubrerythrin
MFSLKDIIDLAIQIEKNGERVYRSAIEKISDPSLTSLLKWLADEEAEHIGWFTELKKKAKKTINDPKLEEMGKTILLDVIGEQSFSLKHQDFTKIQHVKDLFAISIEFEKDTVLFYQMLLPFIEDKDVEEQLNTIIAEEHHHIRKLQGFLESRISDLEREPTF